MTDIASCVTHILTTYILTTVDPERVDPEFGRWGFVIYVWATDVPQLRSRAKSQWGGSQNEVLQELVNAWQLILLQRTLEESRTTFCQLRIIDGGLYTGRVRPN